MFFYPVQAEWWHKHFYIQKRFQECRNVTKYLDSESSWSVSLWWCLWSNRSWHIPLSQPSSSSVATCKITSKCFAIPWGAMHGCGELLWRNYWCQGKSASNNSDFSFTFTPVFTFWHNDYSIQKVYSLRRRSVWVGWLKKYNIVSILIKNLQKYCKVKYITLCTLHILTIYSLHILGEKSHLWIFLLLRDHWKPFQF